MFKWLNERLAGTPHPEAAEALRVEFEPLQKVQGARPHLAERLVRFVLTGDEEKAVTELAALQNTRFLIASTAPSFLPQQSPPKRLPGLIKLLPEDPKVYLRLATVYDAVYQNGGGTFYYGSLPIPVLQGSLSWLNAFLNELSQNGNQRDPIFPASVVLEMLRLAGEDPDVLV